IRDRNVTGVQTCALPIWICFVNKMDRVGADFFRTVDMIRDRLGSHPIPIQLPWGVEDGFHGVIDLVAMTGHYWPDEGRGEQWEDRPIPDDMKELVEHWRHELFEACADYDEEVMEAYVGGADPTPEHLRQAIRAATLSGKATPILCGTAFKNKGVQQLLDAIVMYLPSP